jgi:vancomycin resistance protein YoaR
MSTKLRVLLFAIPVVLIAVPVTAFAFSEAIVKGEIEPEVSAAGIDLSGLGREDALAAMRAYETELRASPVTFTVKDIPFTLSPVTVGLDIDEEAIVDRAMAVRREDDTVTRFKEWLTKSREYPPVVIPVDLLIDDTKLDAVFDAWEMGAIAVPPYEGNIVITDGRIVPEYPRAGEGIDRAVSTELAAAAMRTPTRTVVALPTKLIEPELTPEDLNRWVEEAGRFVDGPVTLTGTDPDVEITFTRDVLLNALRTELKTSSPATFNVWLDASGLVPIIEPFREMIEQEPRDAEIVVDEEEKTVTVIPSRSGVLLDVGQVVSAVSEVAVSESDIGHLPYAVGAAPEISTEDVAAYGPLGLVSTFTTKHDPGQDRVKNIQRFAETIDGAIVQPGEEFSLNGHVGQRTTEKGYLPAGTLISGELVDTVGGGVSQFATTFYNAVFYGCYEDVTHKPHTYYFSRYPEVNEATISWPSLDLKFRNDSETPIWIKTNYTNRTITVEFYGNNGGRTCERRLGNRYQFTTPKTEYRGDPLLDPGVEVEDRKGRGGWTNTVTRVMTFADGTVEEQLWTWRYSAQSQVFYVHPCMLEDAEEECPAVPDVLEQSSGSAQSEISEAGYTVTIDTISTDNPALHDQVANQSPAAGTLKALGSNVTITVYQYTAPPTTTTPPPTTAPPES